MTITSETRRYWAGDLAVTASAPDLEPLDSYLSGYLVGPAGTHVLPEYRLMLHAGQEETACAAAEFTRGPCALTEPVPGVVLTAAAMANGGRCFTVAQDAVEGAPGAWAASISGTRIDLYVADPVRIPRYALRVIRELLIRHCEDAGAVLFHACGVDIEGAAVMICGPGGAGKTTTAAALLHRFAARGSLLSNDRLLVCEDRTVIAVPLPVPAGRGTVSAFPGLRTAVPDVARARPGEPSLGALPLQFGARGKIAFPARAFAAAFGAGLTASSRLGAIMVPSLSDTADPANVRRLTPAEAETVLAACCFTPADEFWRPWLIARTRSEASLSDAAGELCRALAESVPCTSVTFGVRASLARFEETIAGVTGALR